jgi:catechol 2,3-dioxygenase-like lactoylglutathione lyase family enzyme
MRPFRGIEHIGITVPSIEAAEHFFHAAFGAETLYALIDKDGAPQRGEDMLPRNGLLPGTCIVAMRMMRIAHGPNVELFEVAGARGTTAEGPASMGLHHIALYADDLEAAAARFTQAGGTMMDGPITLSGPEEGPGNRCWFGRTPWGLTIELIHLPSPLALDDAQRSGPRWIPQAD